MTDVDIIFDCEDCGEPEYNAWGSHDCVALLRKVNVVPVEITDEDLDW